MKYASKTSVPIERSRCEIERVLKKYGADSFGFYTESDKSMIMFRCSGRYYRMTLPEYDVRSKSTMAAARGEQFARQSWRILLLLIKAKMEAVEAGISSIQQEFMSSLVLPDGSTLGERVSPQIEESYKTGQPPKFLLGVP